MQQAALDDGELAVNSALGKQCCVAATVQQLLADIWCAQLLLSHRAPVVSQQWHQCYQQAMQTWR
jgi:hypothetical protein